MKKILTIDCDFVFNNILDIINHEIESNYIPMRARYWQLKDIYADKFIPDKDRVDFINAIIYFYKNMRKKKIHTILYHHDILDLINPEEDYVMNIDYHKDDADDSPVVYCGNWANYVKNYEYCEDYSVESFGDLQDKEFDEIVICFSPEWTLDVEWIENTEIRNALNKECIKIYRNPQDFFRY